MNNYNMIINYIYLLQEREFIKTKEHIYKVGMTKQENHGRFNQYPKGSILLFQMICDKCKNIENKVIKLFKDKFIMRKDIGNEYFEGDYKNMMDIIYSAIKDETDEKNKEENLKQNLKINIILEESNLVVQQQCKKEYEKINLTPNPKINLILEESNLVEQQQLKKEYEKFLEEKEKEELEKFLAQRYIITTYEEWIKYNQISKIIITNKKGEGYLKFKGQLWRKLYDKNCLSFNKDYMEDLLGFITNNKSDVMKMVSPSNDLVSRCEMNNMRFNYKNRLTDEIITLEEHRKLNEIEQPMYYLLEKDKYEFIESGYDDNKIFQDTIEKCHVKVNILNFYNLNYYEYVFSIHRHPSHTSDYVIFNSVNFTFTYVDDLINNKILTGEDSGGRILFVKHVVNVSIVDDILNSLITCEIKVQFKILVYNLIVKQEEDQIIFYDYNNCLLTTWIRDLLYSISNNKFYIESHQYYENKLEFKKIFKKSKLRCVIISKDSKDIPTIETQIKDFCKLGFKNIIVCQNNKINTMYNIVNFRTYLQDNKELLIKCIKNENNYQPECWESSIKFDDDIFYNSKLLLTNFLKWCCTK